MEPLWSPVVATGGNRSQIARPRKRLNQAKTVAAGRDQLPFEAHGKEGVELGSSRGLLRQQTGSKRPNRLHAAVRIKGPGADVLPRPQRGRGGASRQRLAVRSR